VKAFAALLERLAFTPQRSVKLRLIERYLREAPDPDRGWGLAALTGALTFPHAKPALIRDLAATRADPALFALSYDFVGDLAETVALIWPAPAITSDPPRLSTVVDTLATAPKGAVPAQLVAWLDSLDASGRYALLKLITGGLRVGVSARLAKTAVASHGGVEVAAIEELWHGLTPPYRDLFAWLDGRAGPPAVADALGFRPLMLANPLAAADLAALDPGQYVAEWKWDGIRVQVVARGGTGRIFSRTGDDISHAFPDLARELTFDGVLDGELLVMRDGVVAPFNDVQQRLGRKTVTPALQHRFPAHVRVYDILFDQRGADVRALPFTERRRCLEAWFAEIRPGRMDLSPLLPFDDWAALTAVRAKIRAAGVEGLMLKRRDDPYVAGRPKGPWFKWKRDPLTADCVLMYAQRGHGKRSSYYSDFTFGCWRGGECGAPELVPVGKAYFGFTDAELQQLDRWVRTNTVERYGPVRAVAAGLVLEIAFDSLHPSGRHKSGVAMRFPRVHRIRWDKPAAEADTLDTLCAMIEPA
jgi:DNA ligase 1